MIQVGGFNDSTSSVVFGKGFQSNKQVTFKKVKPDECQRVCTEQTINQRL